MKIPFDIKFRPQIESGEYKVETRDGQPVIILAFDIHFRGISHMILAKYNECYDYWSISGLYNRYSPCCNLDLFIITPEPELSEFEERIFKLLRQYKECDIPLTPENIKSEASMLWTEFEKCFFDLYGKEGEGDSALRSFYHRGFEDGKAEALKDLPRWKQIKDCDTTSRVPHVSTNLVGDKMLYIGNNCISISKIMKLPGFKED